MPNIVCNILRLLGDGRDIAKLLRTVSSPGKVFDFNRIIPEPVDCGDEYSWMREHWGTKSNAYESEQEDDATIRFTTPWASPLPVIQRLSAMFPTLIFELLWSDEAIGNNAGQIIYHNGREQEWFYPDAGDDAREIYSRCWNVRE